MKNLWFTLVIVGICGSTALADFDFTISDTYEGSVSLNNQSLLVEGGGAIQIVAWGSSYVEMQNTLPLQFGVGGINFMGLNDTSTLNYYGGETEGLSIYDDASAVLEGGRIDYIESHQILGQPHIEMIVQEYDFSSYDIDTDLLTGLWADNSAFSIYLENQSGYADVIDNISFTIVPEPATLLLISAGAIFLRKRRN